MKQVFYKLLLVLAVSVISGLIFALPVLATALFTGTIQVTNNSTAASNVATNFTLDTQSLIDNGFSASDLSDVDITYNSAHIPFMPGYGTNPWCLFLPAIGASSIVNCVLSTGGATGGSIAYFPGATGASVNDTMTEPANSYSITLTNAYLDATANGSAAYLYRKGGLFYLSKDASTSGKYTAAIVNAQMYNNFTTDNFTDVNTGIAVNTATEHLEFASDLSATDRRSYADLTAVSDTTWTLTFPFRFTSGTSSGGNNPLIWYGLSSALGNMNAYAGDSLGFWGTYVGNNSTYTAQMFRFDGGAAAGSGTIQCTANVTYYGKITRNTAILATLNVYSDEAMTTNIAGSPTSFAIPATVTALRYIQAANYNNGAGAGYRVNGWFGTTALNSNTLSVSVSGITSGNYTVTSSLTGGTATLTIGSSTNSTAYAGSVLNTTDSWTFCEAGAVLYVQSISYTQGGALVDMFDWENAATFTGSVTGNIMTPSFRTTSSDADVSAELISFAPTEDSELDSFSLAGELPDIGVPTAAAQMYTEDNYSHIPGGPGVNEVLTAAGVPFSLWWFPFIYISICFIGFIIYGATQGPLGQRATSNPYDGSLLTMAIVMEVLIALFGIMNPVPLWPAYLFPIPALAIISSRKHTSIG